MKNGKLGREKLAQTMQLIKRRWLGIKVGVYAGILMGSSLLCNGCEIEGTKVPCATSLYNGLKVQLSVTCCKKCRVAVNCSLYAGHSAQHPGMLWSQIVF